MDDKHTRRSDPDLEAMLRDLNPEDLELLEPPDEVWDGIESAVRAADDTDATVVGLESRRWTVRRTVLGVAAALVLVAAGVAAYTLTRDDPAVVVATASLAYDPEKFDALGAQARAGADLIAEDGRHSIEFVDAALPAPEPGADLEVWLIKPDDKGNVADLVSLGLVDPADPGSLEVPAGFDPGAYFVVDISIEPRDGDAGHSGRSILRGPLQDT
ncbi:MAG: anti-sigma factor [bacterium]|nr:anti-sigma factor [bacterium]